VRPPISFSAEGCIHGSSGWAWSPIGESPGSALFTKGWAILVVSVVALEFNQFSMLPSPFSLTWCSFNFTKLCGGRAPFTFTLCDRTPVAVAFFVCLIFRWPASPGPRPTRTYSPGGVIWFEAPPRRQNGRPVSNVRRAPGWWTARYPL